METNTQLKYRLDIDGLRAIAVLSVIFYHLKETWIPNGFLGVDIFFVISGYLIGGILFREKLNNTFSYQQFYIRRMRRILPAFFAVILITLIANILFVVPGSDEFNILRRSALWSVAFSGNIFDALNIDYFASTLELDALKHMWSLAVEEQFYFLYPIILGIILKLLGVKSSQGIQKNKRGLLIILSSLTLLSFAMAFFPLYVGGEEVLMYYLPHVRFGEILIGAILAIAIPEVKNKSITQVNIIGFIATIILLLCLFLPTTAFSKPWFPGLLALIPCSATALIIAFSSVRGTYLNNFLSLKPIVFIGKISYSLYLWHWGILGFARYYWGIPLTNVQLLLLLIPIIACACISFYTIEQPLRHRSYSFRFTFMAYYVVPSMLVLGLYMVKPNTDPYYNYVHRGSEKRIAENNYAYQVIGDTTQTPKALFIGDSFCIQLYDFFDKMAKKEGWSGVFSGVSSGTPIVDNRVKPMTEAQFKSSLANCGNELGSKKKLNYLRSCYLLNQYDGFSTIYISTACFAFNGLENNWKRLNTLINFFTRHHKKVVLVSSSFNYTCSRLPETSLTLRGFRWIKEDRLTKTEMQGEEYRKDIADFKVLVSRIKAKYPDVEVLNLTAYLPPTMMYKGRTLLQNKNHLNIYGAQYITNKFIANKQKLWVSLEK